MNQRSLPKIHANHPPKVSLVTSSKDLKLKMSSFPFSATPWAQIFHPCWTLPNTHQSCLDDLTKGSIIFLPLTLWNLLIFQEMILKQQTIHESVGLISASCFLSSYTEEANFLSYISLWELDSFLLFCCRTFAYSTFLSPWIWERSLQLCAL